MKLIYSNFDGLDVSFQCRVPAEILDVLEKSKVEAQGRKKDAGAKLGRKGIPVLVGETGARGGYAYRFDTGPDGETWFIATSDKPENWNIRVSVHSLSLALYGYQGVRARLFDFLANIEAAGPRVVDPITDEVSWHPRERISRLDWCADFATEAGYQPDEARFIAHSRCGRRAIDGEPEPTQERVRRGRELESIRIGAMPGRQVAVYNKTREIQASQKGYWWDLWKLNKAEFTGRVWRVEARAGKTELDKWNLRSFADLERMAGDVMSGILGAIRYVTPVDTDTNPTRWPDDPLWTMARDAAGKALAPYTCGADRKKVIRDIRANILNSYRNQFTGMLPGLTFILGLDVSEAPTAIEAIAADMLSTAAQAPGILASKYEQAAQRYVFLGEPAP